MRFTNATVIVRRVAPRGIGFRPGALVTGRVVVVAAGVVVVVEVDVASGISLTGGQSSSPLKIVTTASGNIGPCRWTLLHDCPSAMGITAHRLEVGEVDPIRRLESRKTEYVWDRDLWCRRVRTARRHCAGRRGGDRNRSEDQRHGDAEAHSRRLRRRPISFGVAERRPDPERRVGEVW